MKARALILYGSTTKISRNHQRVKSSQGTPYFIRIEERKQDAITALEYARPKRGESVLNSIAL